MASRKTWLWIILGFVGVCVVALIALAGMGIYFVSHHVSTRQVASVEEAQKAFDQVLTTFTKTAPLFEVDSDEHARATQVLADLPTSATKPEQMWVLVWDPDKDRLVNVSLPFWILRLSRRKWDFMPGRSRGFDLERLNVDMHDLERVGPMVVLDYRTRGGERVLIWTR